MLDKVPDLGWATGIVQDPEAFAALMDSTSREGWVALHSNDLPGAIRASGEQPPAGRAHAELAQVHTDLQRVASYAAKDLIRTWEIRGSRPQAPEVDAFLQAAVDCGAASVGHGTVEPPAGWRAMPFTDRISEKDASGVLVRSWQDPCLHAYAMVEAGRAAKAASTTDSPLAQSLFDGVELDALGLPDGVADTDDPQAAREEVRAMDRILDGTRALLEKEADPDGLALLQQIRPLARLRQEVLVDRARHDLRAGHVQRAYATLLLARDVTEREIGVNNGPALFALLAEANLAAGRSREALDALHPLVATYPETAATREIVSDLVVLQGMGRTGDSKEH